MIYIENISLHKNAYRDVKIKAKITSNIFRSFYGKDGCKCYLKYTKNCVFLCTTVIATITGIPDYVKFIRYNLKISQYSEFHN